MKHIKFIIIILLFHTNSYAKILDQAIVIIEDDVITQSEFEEKLSFTMNQYRVSGNQLPVDREAFREQILEHMITTRLQINYAKNNGLEIKEWMIDKAMENIAERSGVTLSEFREKIISEGIDYKVYRNIMAEELITREVQRRIVSTKVKVSQKEIDDFIKHQSHVFKENNQYKISNILVSLSENHSFEEKLAAEKKINMIRDKFISGENFSNLARNYSDSGNALSGGDLGWRKISEIPKIFINELENLNKGEVSNIIETSNGYYIFHLEDEKELENSEIQETKVRHILIKTNAIVTDEVAKEKLLRLKSRIENGEAFADIARAHSDDTMSAADGGELAWAGPGAFVPNFQDKIDTMSTNILSDPFKSQFGWHILEVLGKRNQDNTELIKRNLAKQYITNSRSRETIDSWLIELKQENYIKYVTESDRSNINEIDIKMQQQWDPFAE